MENSTIVIAVLLASFLTFQVIGSAIPMWEFLSREEKMSRLYRFFSQQAIQFCADSSRSKCNKNLLTTGIRNLIIMDNNILDKLDPYQRGAKEMIWRALVGTNRLTSRAGHEIEGIYFTTNGLSMGNGDSETNNIVEESELAKNYVQVGSYFIGPMVTRVYPDGRPVLEDRTKIWLKDEDIDEFKYTISPFVANVEKNFDRSGYRNKVANYDKKGVSLRRNDRNSQEGRSNDFPRYIRIQRELLDKHNADYH